MNMKTRHVISKDQLLSFTQQVTLASDTGRGKRLTIEVLYSGGELDTRLLVWDMRMPQGSQITTITWKLQDAIDAYNELG